MHNYFHYEECSQDDDGDDDEKKIIDVFSYSFHVWLRVLWTVIYLFTFDHRSYYMNQLIYAFGILDKIYKPFREILCAIS